MPRPVKQLEQVQRPLEERVLELLEHDPQNAYTATEIAARMLGGADTTAVAMFQLALASRHMEERARMLGAYEKALEVLERSRRIRTLKDGATTYYAYAGAP